MLMEYLDEKGFEYETKRVDESNEIREEMAQNSGGFLGVPFTCITQEDGTAEGVIGFDKNKLNSLLGIE